MSLRPSRPLAGVTASQLWANSLDAGELIDKLDADNQKALADLVRGFFSSDGQLIRIVDNHLTRWKGELLKLSDPVTADSDDEPLDGADEGAGSPVLDHENQTSGPSEVGCRPTFIHSPKHAPTHPSIVVAPIKG